jgi:hypothetical protein
VTTLRTACARGSGLGFCRRVALAVTFMAAALNWSRRFDFETSSQSKWTTPLVSGVSTSCVAREAEAPPTSNQGIAAGGVDVEGARAGCRGRERAGQREGADSTLFHPAYCTVTVPVIPA